MRLRIRRWKAFGLSTTLVFCLSLAACAPGGSGTRASQNPLVDANGDPLTGPLIDDEALAAKNHARDVIEAAAVRPSGGRALAREKLENLIDRRDLGPTGGRILRSPRDIESFGLSSAHLDGEVWSGPVWSQYRGHTAIRYALAEARHASSWEEAWRLVSVVGRRFFDVATGVADPEAGGVDDLGAAEKYDLLISNPSVVPQGIFSRYEWAQGNARFAANGSVAKWYGYCHGLASASVSLPRPTHAMTVLAADGRTRITFYPEDVKALATALWANSLPPLRLIGQRCNLKSPKRDPSGHILDAGCFDVNPGVFHLAVINQIGLAHRPLIIDATYDLQIWNQPIVSYSYSYFNPSTKKRGTLAESAIARSAFAKDPYAKFRSSSAKSIVGVKMEIQYVASVSPHRHVSDGPSKDTRKSVTYRYDLELAADGHVIGGEWYQLRHPDFLWSPVRGARAKSQFESRLTGRWNPAASSVPRAWTDVARRSAERGQPLAAIVEPLIAWANAQSGSTESSAAARSEAPVVDPATYVESAPDTSAGP